mmetsp:Transcript_78380/g.151394  ORF Transcript_78380/g.151394 Transcript_78380/m.151394 type:complete len:92 (-) Transcript_78380:1008-1283(-)
MQFASLATTGSHCETKCVAYQEHMKASWAYLPGGSVFSTCSDSHGILGLTPIMLDTTEYKMQEPNITKTKVLPASDKFSGGLPGLQSPHLS